MALFLFTTPMWSGDHPDPSISRAPYRLYNIGNHNPMRLLDFIAEIEKALGKTVKKNLLPMQPGEYRSEVEVASSTRT